MSANLAAPPPVPTATTAPASAPVVPPAVMRAPATRALDWLNFFVADMQASVGPFLAVYLAGEGWDELHVGLALTIAGFAAIAAQTPAGALVDRIHSKRALVAVSTVLTGLCALAIAWWPKPAVIYGAEAIMGVAGGVLGAAIYGITLGMTGPVAFGPRQGRNRAFNAAGNIFASLTVGLAAYVIDNRTALFAGAAFAVPALMALAALSPRDIDYDRARGAQTAAPAPPVSLRLIFGKREVLIFIACVVLFNFANGAMLPLVGEHLARTQGASSMAFMAACIITTQCVAAATSGWIGRIAIRGRKPLLLAAFLALALRGLLYTQTSDPTLLVAIQVLDGIGNAVLGVVTVLVIADLTAGNGRFNLTLGAITTTVGIGAAASQGVGGGIVHLAGYQTGMFTLAGVAFAALGLLAWAMPETLDYSPPAQN